MKIINTLEAIIGLCGTIWLFLYYTGRVNYTDGKEKRRQENVDKHGWLIIVACLMCLFGSIAIIVGTFFDF